MNGLFESNSESQAGDSSQPDSGVLGRLPRTRPSKRSPRRADAAAREARQARAAASAASAGPAASGAKAPRPADQGTERGALEEVARAGFGLAVGVAEVGFRVAGGALGAIRNAGRR